jgi:uncharacterized protein (DUF2141 family)
MQRWLLALLFCAGCGDEASGKEAPVPLSGASSNKLVVKVGQLRSSDGVIRCALYNSEKSFLSTEKAAQIKTAKIDGKEAVCVFSNLTSGEYAVGAFHDENNNNVLDANFIGIPREGLGVSNNPKSSFGPPKYKDAKFNYQSGEVSISISTVYL